MHVKKGCQRRFKSLIDLSPQSQKICPDHMLKGDFTSHATGKDSYLHIEPAHYAELGTETSLETLNLFVRTPTAVSLGDHWPYKKD